MEHTREECLAEITKYEKAWQNVNDNIPFFIRMSMIIIDCRDVKKKLLSICTELMNKLLIAIFSLMNEKNAVICKDIENIKDSISGKAETAERLVELEQNIDKTRKSEFARIHREFQDLTKWLSFLYNTSYKISDEDLNKIYKSSLEVFAIMGIVDYNENRVRAEREDLETKLRKRKSDFTANLDTIATQIEKLKDASSTYVYKDVNEQIDNYNKKLKEYNAELIEINQKEELIGWQTTEFPKLQEAMQALKPYDDLWRTVRDTITNIQSWTKDKSIFKLDADQVERETKKMLTTAISMTITFNKSTPNPLNIANKILNDIKDFNVHVPLVRALCNPGLKERHWEDIRLCYES